MTRQAQIFRVQYIGCSGIIKEVEIAARNTGEAIRVAREAMWPPKAVSLRLVDTLGQEVFEEQKADLG